MAKNNRRGIKRKYERDKMPNPNNYFIKDYPYYTAGDNYSFYTTGYNYPLPVIVRRYPKPYQDITTKSPPKENIPRMYKCDLCDEVFNSENELDKHMDIAAH